MEQEMQAKWSGTMTMGPPPSYQESKSKTKPFLIAIVTVTFATLLVVSVGVFYLMFNGQSRPAVINNFTTDDDEPVVIVRDVSFKMSDGVPRHEQMIAGGNELIIENSHDGYTVVFDFVKQLAVFKNRTTSSCYFTRLDALPVEMKMDNLSANLPVFFTEASTQNNELLENSNTMVFSNLQPIPTGYLELTTTEICANGLSFWIESKEAQGVRYTRSNCDSNCVVVVVAVVAIVALGG